MDKKRILKAIEKELDKFDLSTVTIEIGGADNMLSTIIATGKKLTVKDNQKSIFSDPNYMKTARKELRDFANYVRRTGNDISLDEYHKVMNRESREREKMESYLRKQLEQDGTFHKLAKQGGVSPVTLSRFKKGKQLRLATLKKLSEIARAI